MPAVTPIKKASFETAGLRRTAGHGLTGKYAGLLAANQASPPLTDRLLIGVVSSCSSPYGWMIEKIHSSLSQVQVDRCFSQAAG
jgi:hypothetical protein